MKILRSTQALKKKASKKYQVGLNTWDCELQLEIDYLNNTFYSLTACDAVIRILFVLILIIGSKAVITDAHSTFYLVKLKGNKSYLQKSLIDLSNSSEKWDFLALKLLNSARVKCTKKLRCMYFYCANAKACKWTATLRSASACIY